MSTLKIATSISLLMATIPILSNELYRRDTGGLKFSQYKVHTTLGGNQHHPASTLSALATQVSNLMRYLPTTQSQISTRNKKSAN
jgi:hypothetical protein